MYQAAFSNSSVEGDVTGGGNVGGLVGRLDGGIVSSNAIITNSFAKVAVSNDGLRAGGLVGNAEYGEISNSYTTGDVNGKEVAGGLVGSTDLGVVLSNNYATGTVSGEKSVGGLVGSASGTINSSFSTGSVSGTKYGIGGLIGKATSISISNSYALGSVNGEYSVGGLVGDNHNAQEIKNSYAAGSVSVSGSGTPGRLIGQNSPYANKKTTNSYYDKDTSGQSDDDGNGEPKASSEMIDQSTFSGWDFTSIWGINNGEYPHLQFHPHSAAPPVVNNGIIYVNETKTSGNNDGTSWDDAFIELQDGLDAASDGDYQLLATSPAINAGSDGLISSNVTTDLNGDNRYYGTIDMGAYEFQGQPAVNEAPVIDASDKVIAEGDTFDPLDGVTATDAEDGDVTDDIQVTTNDVDTSIPGDYTVVYEVTDSDGEEATKTITVTVEGEPNEAPEIDASDTTIMEGDTFDPLDGVTATDAEDGDVTDDIQVTTNDVDTSIPGDYTVVYEVTDSDGEKATKTITVTVEADSNDPGDNETDPGDNDEDSVVQDGELPKTATSIYSRLFIGSILLVAGLVLIISRRKKLSK